MVKLHIAYIIRYNKLKWRPMLRIRLRGLASVVIETASGAKLPSSLIIWIMSSAANNMPCHATIPHFKLCAQRDPRE